MRTKAIELVEAKNVSEAARKAIPVFQAGDTLRVHTKVREGEKERVQIFEGVCIRLKNAGTASTFTVRKVSYGSASSASSRCSARASRRSRRSPRAR